uniref:IMD domain-containing protein n=1 Tax=Eptatretus burgeri TaxID=7764 RepID=A0A8C4QJ92_EPTBU
MEGMMERECGALGSLFQAVMSDMKVSYPVWEDFISKASKLHTQLRATLVAAVAFLDSFQKVADMATNTRGATREIGSALTRMCLRHRSIETKLGLFTQALAGSLIGPLQERLEEWRKMTNQMDKEHAKEYKRARQDIKKKSTDTIRLQKKAKKGETFGRGEMGPVLGSAMQEVTDTYLLLEETEKRAVRRALIEERGRYCTFVHMFRSVLNHEVSMLGDVTHLQTILEDLDHLTKDPHKLPPASEQLMMDLKGTDVNWNFQPSPPASPSTSSSRKSSACSSLNSVHSSDSRSSGSQAPSPGSQGHLTLANPAPGPLRLSSISSDSGFTSQDAAYSKPPSPMPSQILYVDGKRISHDLSQAAAYGMQPRSGDTISLYGAMCGHFVNGEPDEMLIAAFDKSATISRSSDIARAYRHMFHNKRAISVSGPHLEAQPSCSVANSVATIRRAPALRRTSSTTGPIPIQTPIVPPKPNWSPSSPLNLAAPLGITNMKLSSAPSSPISPGFGPSSAGWTPSSPQATVNPAFMGGKRSSSLERGLAIQINVGSTAAYSRSTQSGPDSNLSPQRERLVSPRRAHDPSAFLLPAHEDQKLAQNYQNIAAELGALAARAHALGEEPATVCMPPSTKAEARFLHTLSVATRVMRENDGEDLRPAEGSMLCEIRGVRLRRTRCNDRSDPLHGFRALIQGTGIK